MTDRRPLGTGPTRPATETDAELAPVPRAQLAAERLPVVQAAAEPRPAPTVGRRVLGAGPTGQ
ncbi:hypothetical protein [Streptomyces sp. NRRL WC-3795]|uniref:hypothetical protein n=1 Tax=Streptomyces sp. NRRL WC-3795 TaxID=1463938 RepID=UPI0004CB9871|nr:hypothetical protein [Streptomyces sp. NRRL WC-3795]